MTDEKNQAPPATADDRMENVEKIEYTREMFLMAMSSFINMAQGLRHVNTEEVSRWMKKEMTPQLANKESHEMAQRFIDFVDAFHTLRETLKITGVPRPQQGPESDAPVVKTN